MWLQYIHILSSTVLEILFYSFTNTQLDSVIQFHINWIDIIVFPKWHLPLWCAANSFLQYTYQLIATMNCLCRKGGYNTSFSSSLAITAYGLSNFSQFLVQVYGQASSVSLALTLVFLLLAGRFQEAHNFAALS
jgi:hypothetical protein